jgi:hypothetical protein
MKQSSKYTDLSPSAVALRFTWLPSHAGLYDEASDDAAAKAVLALMMSIVEISQGPHSLNYWALVEALCL